jgi:hypothetical protein
MFDILKTFEVKANLNKGSEYQNKIPSEIDKMFYDYVKKEFKKVFQDDDRISKKIFYDNKK